ncbi:malectin-like carbohydrate-binding domain-containing protein [Artemisia annua]|uniref:Malectin-like carbohydrate-binding domain-containing protein n=1 Tax=Artemisia annua TaxID=35608 RepID=A0A2U1M650_ARTAN|nr:malectin-like carbohydrate-binding domain-containing protein [Artemisia annua]
MAGHFKLLPILLLALFTLTVTSEFIASINCGGPDFWQWISDDRAFISWTSDDNLVSNGEAHVVPSSNSLSDQVDTLRVFTSRKKNCYSNPVTLGQKVLVRASFYYGNYDGLSKPPMFDLHFDGNFWTTVETSSTELTVHEITYVTKGDAISVCVAKTKHDQFPFMSALEIRSVDSEVYNPKGVDNNRALFLISRLAYGASQTIRYPDDDYDRMWMPVLDVTNPVTSDDPLFSFESYNISTPDHPPQAIFQNAMSSGKANNLIVGTFSPSNSPYLINMYYSEVNTSIIDTSVTRSFRLYEMSTSGSELSDTITPPILSVYEWSTYNYKVDSTTVFSLNATVDSDLPPLINAMEVFRIGDVLTNGTHSNDVEALALLRSTFDMLGGWSGDPCLPANYSWDWVNCSDDDTPRVTSLYLDSFGLSGSFPDISSMDALEIIDLHNNSLSGTIPSFLGSMPNLQRLDLANNQFSGQVPASLSKNKNKNLELNYTGNPSLCTSGKSCSSSPGTSISSPGSTSVAGKKKSKLPVIFGTIIPSFLLIWIAAGIFTIVRRKMKPANANGSATGGGATNGITNGMQKMGEDLVNEIVNTGVQQVFGSPSPLLNVNSSDTTV